MAGKHFVCQYFSKSLFDTFAYFETHSWINSIGTLSNLFFLFTPLQLAWDISSFKNSLLTNLRLKLGMDEEFIFIAATSALGSICTQLVLSLAALLCVLASSIVGLTWYLVVLLFQKEMQMAVVLLKEFPVFLHMLRNRFSNGLPTVASGPTRLKEID